MKGRHEILFARTMILRFAARILLRKWSELLLPFVSIFLISLIASVSSLLVQSATDLLASKNKELIGGDLVLESSKAFDERQFTRELSVESISREVSFFGTLASGERTGSARFKFFDDAYQLYGQIKLRSGRFVPLGESEVYVDATLAEALGIAEGSLIVFNQKTFAVKGVVVEDPEALTTRFDFLGRVYLSDRALVYSGVDLELYRREYSVKIKVTADLPDDTREKLKRTGTELGVRVRTDSGSAFGIQTGLANVERFLVITVLLLAILALVNVYASVSYLVNRLRRSFAILMSLGFSFAGVQMLLLVITSAVLTLGISLGLAGAIGISHYIDQLVVERTGVALGVAVTAARLLAMFLGLFVISIFATLPVVRQLRTLSTRTLLSHAEPTAAPQAWRGVTTDLAIALFPLTIFAIYFLADVSKGLLIIGCMVVAYGAVMSAYALALSALSRWRHLMPFSLRLIIAQKHFDGLYGRMAFASLFVALAAVYTLSLVRSSLDDYLHRDLATTMPGVYLIDVQRSQKDSLLRQFDDLTLFPNVRARILEIDGRDVQNAIDNKEDIDRELIREFNLTYRNELLKSETVLEGVFPLDQPGSVSVEQDFANRLGLKMGSELLFSVQGFKIKASVTSIRQADKRSGYPFFYFVLPPRDLERFPQTFFGYANYRGERVKSLADWIATEAPNATVINTESITRAAQNVINFLLVVLLIVALPPLLLSSLLVVTLILSGVKDRKRDAARLIALGQTQAHVRNQFIAEALSTTALASAMAYLCAWGAAQVIQSTYLNIRSTVYVDTVSAVISSVVFVVVLILSVWIWTVDKRSVREVLGYEENA